MQGWLERHDQGESLTLGGCRMSACCRMSAFFFFFFDRGARRPKEAVSQKVISLF